MKVSVITVCYNCEKTIEKTIKSVLEQKYNDIEYIVIDGGSQDDTLEIIKKYESKITKFVSEKDKGIYDAINKGIKLSKGEVVSLLHGNDIFFDENVISKVAEFFIKNQKVEIMLSDLAFKNKFEQNYFTRYYSAKKFRPWMLRIGISPPHLSTFFKQSVFIKVGFYETKFKIAGDFDYFVRCFLIHKIKFKYFENCLVLMSTGGESGKNLKSYITSSKEINFSLKSNLYYSNIFITFLRFPIKLFQFFYK